MINELSSDPSLYLQQHKNNPVHWKKWNTTTLNLAKIEKKPILLSVGYSSCHWCHVMAHESFEDKETADLMNKYFINIKVDREERPDLDYLFQSSFQLLNQSGGGWPLTMFLDENGVPFTGGTYFPKEEKHGLPSFKNLLRKVAEIYDEQRDKILSQSKLIKQGLNLKKNAVLKQDLEPLIDNLITRLDEKKGGFKGQPKFPTFYFFDSLIYFYNKTKKQKYLDHVDLFLKNICSQGIFDHVEGGIFRYTVDENWLIPHFEKMFYDNIQLIILLAKYLKIKKNDYFRNKLIKTIDFLLKNFFIEDHSLMGTAIDADSEGEEGKYYTFIYDEIKNIENIDKFFRIDPKGNWENKIILTEKKGDINEKIIEELLKVRKIKPSPIFDKKIQLDLNSYWISALIIANEVVPEKNYNKLALKFLNKLDKKFVNGLCHSQTKGLVFLEDYAYLIQALIDLYDTSFNFEHKNRAIDTCKNALNIFFNKEKKIFQKNKISSDDLFHEVIDVSDGTIPNGNSIMLLNLTRIGMLEEAKVIFHSLNGYLNNYSGNMISSIKALDYYSQIIDGKNCNLEGCSK